MSGPSLDVSAYPVLRIDEIPFHDDETLRKALVDAQNLLISIQTDKDASQRSMERYIVKQLDTMSTELAKRKAQNRIYQMLSGELAPDDVSYVEPLSDLSTSSVHIPTSAPPAIDSRRTNQVITQVPLPSELRRVESLQSREAIPKRARDLSKSSSASTEDIKLVTSTSTPTLNDNSLSSGRRFQHASAPSRQSLQALNNAFGVSFVVAATERKKRHVAKKVVVDVELEKEKARQDRFY